MILSVLKNNILRIKYLFRRLFTEDKRHYLSCKYLKGRGLEVGALHMPLYVSAAASVKYVDRLSLADLRTQYPELRKLELVHPDIVDDAETLVKIGAESQDFLIANHLLEHCENPIGAIKTFLRVVRENGIIYMAVPDKRFTFDCERAVTTLEHLIKDNVNGSACSREAHLNEWHQLVDKQFSQDAERDLAQLKRPDYSLHFHVWTPFEIFELLVYLRKDMSFGFEILEFVQSDGEAIYILKKTGAKAS